MSVVLDVIALSFIYYFVFLKRWKQRGTRVLLLNTTMYIYICFVLYFNLMPMMASIPHLFDHNDGYAPINLVPFIDVINKRGDHLRQIILNIIMTIPFGFFLPLVGKKMNLIKTVLITTAFSISIEFLQLFSIAYRATDITDVITNTLGGLIGYCPYKVLNSKVLNSLFASSTISYNKVYQDCFGNLFC